MKIIVCVKQVLDPEMPVSSFQVDREQKKVVPPPGTPPVVNPFDENAIEAALRLKEIQGAEVVALSVGRKLSRPVLKKALSAGADVLYLVEDSGFDDLDGFVTAQVLAAAISKIGEFDLVITGRQAADWDRGVTGSALAELLGVACITVARKIEVDGRTVRVERVVDDGGEVVEASMPCVVTVTNELGALRQITLPDIMRSKQKPVLEWTAAELGMERPPARRSELQDLFIPVRDTVCKMVEGETPEQAGEKLAEVICNDCNI
jgi:electron transfer flavoprotein beta subunit